MVIVVIFTNSLTITELRLPVAVIKCEPVWLRKSYKCKSEGSKWVLAQTFEMMKLLHFVSFWKKCLFFRSLPFYLSFAFFASFINSEKNVQSLTLIVFKETLSFTLGFQLLKNCESPHSVVEWGQSLRIFNTPMIRAPSTNTSTKIFCD